jgi:hypothetical protein
MRVQQSSHRSGPKKLWPEAGAAPLNVAKKGHIRERASMRIGVRTWPHAASHLRICRVSRRIFCDAAVSACGRVYSRLLLSLSNFIQRTE